MPTPVVAFFHSRGVEAFPGYSVFILPWAGHKSSVGAVSRGQASAQLGGGTMNLANAQNNEVVWDIWLEAGTYKIALVSAKSTDLGIATFLFDGNSLGTIDTYGAGTNNNYDEITGITIAAAQGADFTMRAATKNASSSGYGLQIQSIALIRTGA